MHPFLCIFDVPSLKRVSALAMSRVNATRSAAIEANSASLSSVVVIRTVNWDMDLIATISALRRHEKTRWPNVWHLVYISISVTSFVVATLLAKTCHVLRTSLYAVIMAL